MGRSRLWLLRMCRSAAGPFWCAAWSGERQLERQYTRYDVILIGCKALAHALVDGRAVNEFDPADKAVAGMNNLWQLRESSLWLNAPRSAR